MKFDVIDSDPPWDFSDRLTMSDVKRGAASQYKILDDEAIKNLNVKEVAADDSVLALWVPSSILQTGLDTMSAWGFRQTQTQIWVKVKNDPFKKLAKLVDKIAKGPYLLPVKKRETTILRKALEEFDLDDILNFKMGRLFRQTHEVCLIGVRGKVYKKLQNKSQRSVHFYRVGKHSEKPEILQDRLDVMFPNAVKLEMFARRCRPGWTCVGWECPGTEKEDIRDSLERLIKL